MNELKLKPKLEIKEKGNQEELIKMAHDESVRGYYGGKKMSLRLSENFYWPNMLQDCKDWSKHVKCAKRSRLKK